MNESLILELLYNENSLEWQKVCISLTVSLIFGIIIAQVYKKTSKDNFYENDFGLTLIIVTIIINSIMLTIGSNIALSLGLIGSLSIIRFRTAIKGSVDMSFLFWSIAAGLAIGANQYVVAVVCSIIVIIVVFLINRPGFLSILKKEYVAIINAESKMNKKKLDQIFSKYELKCKLKSSFSDKDGLELTYSIRTRNKQNIDYIAKELNAIAGVESVSILNAESNIQI